MVGTKQVSAYPTCFEEKKNMVLLGGAKNWLRMWLLTLSESYQIPPNTKLNPSNEGMIGSNLPKSQIQTTVQL